ncbi:MAG: C1 family peptidase [Thermoguttaceae bacterium]|nr:C1 family peptidase [Thermoguttaceae bacterium]
MAACAASPCPGTEPVGAGRPAHSPASVDLRPNFQRWNLPARVQGARGTCSAFVVTGALEYALAAKRQQGVRLSVEFLNWASNQVTGRPDDGGFFSDLWKGYREYGICPESEMPYRDHFDPHLKPTEKALSEAKAVLASDLRLHWIKEWDPNKGLNDQQLADVRRTLQRGWPVCGGFLWPKREHWENGVLQMCPRSEVRDGHSVLLVGFRDDPAQPGGGVFLIQNSSGARRDGLMTYEYVRTYMNDAVWIDYVGAGDLANCGTILGKSVLTRPRGL